MRRSVLTLATALLCSLATHPVRAQQTLNVGDSTDPLAAHIGVAAKPMGDSIILRWGTSNAPSWLAGAESGYVIEREGGGAKTVVAQSVKPWPKERWSDLLARHEAKSASAEPDFVVVAYSLLYDEATTVTSTLAEGDAKEIRDKNSQLEMRRSFVLMAADRDAEAAEALGLRFVDRNVKPGVNYTYTVRLASPTRTYHVDAGRIAVANAIRKDVKQIPLKATEGDGVIGVQWLSGIYGSFFIERSEDGGKTFHRLNKLPQITLRQGKTTEKDSNGYLDTTVINYHPYVYRILGTTAFADIETVGEVRAMGRDVTPPGQPLLYQPKQVADHEIALTWIMHEPAAADLVGFRVYRGPSDSGAFQKIADGLAPTARTFTDRTFSDTVHNYYYIETYDTARNTSHSFPIYAPLIDSIPPVAPAWLSGTMDTNGIVTLKLKGNMERDLMGYRLLKANAEEHEFSPFYESYVEPDDPQGQRTTYYDTSTINTLTKYIYYKAIALDRNYNESPLSEVIRVARPDKIAPVAPVITAITPTDSDVVIECIPSSSDDVAAQLMLRRESGQTKWDTLDRGKAFVMFADHNVVANTTYEYAMQAVDDAGNYSKLSGIVTARPYAASTMPSVRDLRAAPLDDKSAITVLWTNPAGTSRAILYRGEGDKPVEQYAQLVSGEARFLDKNISKGVLYTYAVKVFNANGAESQLSDTVKMDVR